MAASFAMGRKRSLRPEARRGVPAAAGVRSAGVATSSHTVPCLNIPISGDRACYAKLGADFGKALRTFVSCRRSQ